MNIQFRSSLLWPVLALVLAGCGDDEQHEQADAAPGTPVTVAMAQTGDAVVTERTVGRIEAETAPMITAEVPGTVARVQVEIGDRVEEGQTLAELDSTDLGLALRQARAEVNRLRALSANQARTVERYRELRRAENVSAGMLEEAESQLTALQEQLDGAQSQLATGRRNLERSIIRAPVAGQIQTRQIAVGDYVAVNDPLFQIATNARLRVHLPFPEGAAGRLQSGQTAHLNAAAAPEHSVEQPIASLRPMLIAGARAIEALVFLDNPGGWVPGGSVNAEVEVARRSGAVLVPEISVVQRPAGSVVFVVDENDTVSQVPVTTGVKRGGQVEIRSGLNGGERIVADGAGFLTDGAKVQVSESP